MTNTICVASGNTCLPVHVCRGGHPCCIFCCFYRILARWPGKRPRATGPVALPFHLHLLRQELGQLLRPGLLLLSGTVAGGCCRCVWSGGIPTAQQANTASCIPTLVHSPYLLALLMPPALPTRTHTHTFFAHLCLSVCVCACRKLRTADDTGHSLCGGGDILWPHCWPRHCSRRDSHNRPHPSWKSASKRCSRNRRGHKSYRC